MTHPNCFRTALACCAFAAITFDMPAYAASAYNDADADLDDCAPSLRLVGVGNTPFPRFVTARGVSSDDVPAPSVGIALCVPDLYCTLESEPRY
ncbi:MAG: hypothetical protein CPDRYMAC_6951 [uncultured Paraburkholderia sp.]|nr:MAG: hypothetical protein CPDRYDRY_6918 [uncultured Paraburkholderia sp.]CAH2945603.1 MAG: hypothetical protein CPDRYMAC_6951 [uncultured Paraburkholderia sp.]